MGTAISEVVPGAIGLVLVNPLPVMAVILLLFSPKARITAPAFVLGWLLGLIVVFGVLLFIAPLDAAVGSERQPTGLALVVRLLVGLGLLVLALRHWRKRPPPGAEAALPSWMASLDRASPLLVVGLGALASSINPKNLAFTVNAALNIAQAGLSPGQKVIPVAVFILLASIGVAAPVIWRAVSPERSVTRLAEWRVWLGTNYALLMAVVLLVFGVVVIAQALGGLLG